MDLEKQKQMPVWGPYSKKYMGLSRVMKESAIPGARFDLVIYPTYANSSVPAPNVTVPSNYHPWQADPEGRYFQYRYELIWKDQLYADVEFFELDEETWGVRVEYHNHTDRPQNCLLNLLSAIEYPQITVNTPVLPEKHDYWKAIDYQNLQFARKRPWDRLNPDGLKKGEVQQKDFVDGVGVGETFYAFMAAHLKLKAFGGDSDDTISFRQEIKNQYRNGVLCVRYQTVNESEDVVFTTAYGDITFEKTNTTRIAFLELGQLEPGVFQLDLVSKGTNGNGVKLDFFCIVEREDIHEITVTQTKRNVIPDIEETGHTTKYRYHYHEKEIGLTIFNPRVRKRTLHSGCIEDALVTRMSNSDHTYDDLTQSFSNSFQQKHSDDGFYHINVVEAIFLAPNTSKTEYLYVSSTGAQYTQEQLEKKRLLYVDQQQKCCNRAGEPFAFAVRLMKSAIFSNVVYPICRHGCQIIHYTPGKRWDSLYTWDSGMIGIGMLEYSTQKAEYVLDTYLSEKDNQDFAFLFHGSMVPTQFYLFYELLQKLPPEGKARLKQYYPMLRRYYQFFAGKSEGSTTARYKSGLLTVYDYFYNASGMDDYPAQVELHKQKLEHSVAPLCSSVHLVRIAKFMKAIAEYFGYEQDVQQYADDAKQVGDAIVNHAWDEESGYFGYVVHDGNLYAAGILRTETGENYNKGVDGVTPLIAGVTTPEQTQRLLAHLTSQQELFTPVGISTVDQSAGYYYDNGYWNGSVWLPYQYFLWKSMLDLGYGEFAEKIAKTALHAWSQETDFSYNTFELIQIESERGGWFHQFSGLSSPLVVWYHSYYKPGNVTVGFDTWLEEWHFSNDYSSARIRYKTSRVGGLLLAVMNEEYSDYSVTIDGEPAQFAQRIPGTLEIQLLHCQGEVIVQAK